MKVRIINVTFQLATTANTGTICPLGFTVPSFLTECNELYNYKIVPLFLSTYLLTSKNII